MFFFSQTPSNVENMQADPAQNINNGLRVRN